MKIHCFRLKYGQDLLIELKKYLEEKNIKAATILSGVGCVIQAKLRDASGVNIKTLCEHLEIVSLMGTLSCNRTHLHISLSKEDLSTVGGHLVEGCIINTTAEIILLELDNLEFDKEFDDSTGYNELLVKSI